MNPHSVPNVNYSTSQSSNKIVYNESDICSHYITVPGGIIKLPMWCIQIFDQLISWDLISVCGIEYRPAFAG